MMNKFQKLLTKSKMSSVKINSNSISRPNSSVSCIKNFELNPQQQQQLQDIAIRRIGSDLLKALKAIQQSEFIEARNRIDIPNGLFGLSLDSFYERRNENENTVYIDVLQMVCKVTLEQAKICIILDDLYDFVKKLFLGYQNMESGAILSDISNSEKFLSISESIAKDFKKNSELLKNLQDKLNAFNVRETNAILYVNSQVYGVQNDCVEVELVLEPIEFRYKMSFHQRTTEQSIEKAHQIETSLQNNLDNIEISANRNNIVSDSIQIKQRRDIEILKSRLQEMTVKYDREYEILDGQISYKTNAIESMRDQYKDCLAKLDFYNSDIGRLREWKAMWIQKELEDAKTEPKNPKTKKKKGAAKKGKKNKIQV